MHCDKEFSVLPYRVATAKFCTVACKGDWQKVHGPRGSSHPDWIDQPRSKVCKNCGKTFEKKPTRAMSLFLGQEYCSHKCGVEGRNTIGENNPNWKGGHSNRSSKQHKWATAVISRDLATCQKCGVTGVEMHAHHINSFKEHPDLRWELSNGETLCYQCHWDEHSTKNEKAVNSGKLQTGNAVDNPEPSHWGNLVEGATTRGRAYRRVEANCPTCGKFLSKRLSDVKGKAFIACSRSCAGTYTQKLLKLRRIHGSNASKSAAQQVQHA